jgi:peptidoglycan/xylan/chitin deacetylase (PgdA/CDA1 family)
MPSLSRILFPRLLLSALPKLRTIPALSRRLARTVVVLGYHDLRGPGDIDSWLRVEVGSFRRQLRLLSSVGSFIAPEQLTEPRDLPGPGPHFLLTFDDGYPNWLRLGVPVLEEFRVSGLFFLSCENLLTGQAFWFDRILAAVQGNRLRSLDLTADGLGLFRFRSRDPGARWDDIERLLGAIKRGASPGTSGWDRLMKHMDDLAKGAQRPDGYLRPMSPPELTEMAQNSLCRVGSHGYRHEIMTRLDRGAALESLTRSRDVLRSATRQPVEDFAYPNGDCSDELAGALSVAGYRRGFTTTAGAYGLTGDALRIPRLLVGGYDSLGRIADRLGGIVLGRLAGGPARRRAL